MDRLVVLADDFTGACDAAGAFAGGRETLVVLAAPEAWPVAPGGVEAVEVLSVDLDQRERDDESARQVAHTAALRLTRLAPAPLDDEPVASAARLFLKIDSTLRGPIAGLVAGALSGSGKDLAVVAPAFPAQGRFLYGGTVVLDAARHVPAPGRAEMVEGGAVVVDAPRQLPATGGTVVDGNTVRADPRGNPGALDEVGLHYRRRAETGLSLTAILGDVDTAVLGADVAQSAADLESAIERARRHGARHVVVDTDSRLCLANLASVWTRHAEWLLVGSGGLARELADGSRRRGPTEKADAPPRLAPTERASRHRAGKAAPAPSGRAGPDATEKAPPVPTQSAGPNATEKAPPALTRRAGLHETEKAAPVPTQSAGPNATEKAPPAPTRRAGLRETEKAAPAPTQRAGLDATEKAAPAPTRRAGLHETEKAAPVPTQSAGPNATEKAPPAPTRRAGLHETEKAAPAPTQRAGLDAEKAVPAPTERAGLDLTGEAAPDATRGVGPGLTEVGGGPTLIVAGSPSPMTRAQIEYLRPLAPFTVVETAALEPPLPPPHTDLLVLCTPPSDARDSGQNARAVADTVLAWSTRIRPGAVILAGGATARLVCERLGTTGVELRGELAPGVPIGRLVGGQWDRVTVVTKAGGFGTPTTLLDAIRALAP